jgi:phosphomannomutase
MSENLIVSVSGMRGIVGPDLTPELVVRHAAALGAWAGERSSGQATVVLGRDARTSGAMFAKAAEAGLMSVGCDVIDLGIVPTPTVQLAVEHHGADAGLILTASHNPIEWNALKLVGPDGIFLDAESGATVRTLAETGPPRTDWSGLGSVRPDTDAVSRHINLVLELSAVDVDAIRARGFHVALDCVRGAGGTIMPDLLERLGCRVTGINLETDGRFPRAPEPIPEHLGQLGALVVESKADIGVAVDPDVDRLALVDETGHPIGEDYTLAFAVRAVLGAGGAGPVPTVVANLSTSLVVEDAARAGGAAFIRAPVGEANVAQAIKANEALIGGEGNGGVMFPAAHIGRDAPVGLALILHFLATTGLTISELVGQAPRYRIVKNKLPRGADLEAAYREVGSRFADATVDRRDGVRWSWDDRWVHLRPSGTEPVVRIIAEAPTEEEARALVGVCRDVMDA